MEQLQTDGFIDNADEAKALKAKRKAQNRKHLIREVKEHKLVYLMILPVLLSYLIFEYYPMYGVVLAIKDFSPVKGILGSPFVEPLFSNFSKVFAAPYFWRAIKNTLIISGLKILICFPAPIFLALLLNEVRFKTVKKSIQTFVYLPHFISWVIFGSIVYDIFGFQGMVNNVIVSFGGTRKAFMSDTSLYYPILIGFSVLKDAGWASIIYLAAITNVSPSLYEAAEMDGCGRFGKMWNITVPCISGIITIQFLLAIGNIMNAGFDAIFNTYNEQIYSVADILDTYIYRIGIANFNYEMGTAIGLFKSAINFILLISANFFVKKINGTGIYDLGD